MAREHTAEMHFLRNMGLVLTYRCQIACPHCVLEAGPHRTEATALTDAINWVGQIARYRDGHVHFLSLTGGEPFFDVPTLRRLSEHAASLGLLVSVATNGFWATSRERATEVLRGLPGVRVLSVSTDVYHQAFIGLDRVCNVVQAAAACGVPCRVAVCTESRTDPGYLATLGELAEFTDPRDIDTTITFSAGRALTRLGMGARRTADRPPRVACTAAATPVIMPNGRVLGCVGPLVASCSDHPLVLGDLREEPLESILDRAQQNAVLHALRAFGPHKLVRTIEEHGPRVALPRSYDAESPCDTCRQIFDEPRTVAFLAELASDPDFRDRVAWARLHYLDEPEMLARTASSAAPASGRNAAQAQMAVATRSPVVSAPLPLRAAMRGAPALRSRPRRRPASPERRRGDLPRASAVRRDP